MTGWAERKAIIAQRTMVDDHRPVCALAAAAEGAGAGDGKGAAADGGRQRQRIASHTFHWHVWDFDLLHEVVGDCLGYELNFAGLDDPYHQMVVATKPRRRGG